MAGLSIPKTSSKILVGVMQNVLAFYEYIITDPHHRYRSWDHCYSYFQGLAPSSTKKDIDLASLHLAFYLASWGMYRGSSFILWKDYQIHTPTIRLLLEQQYRPLWNLDLNTVRTENAELTSVFSLASRLRQLYVAAGIRINGITAHRIPTDTLVTKILLGTLACTPAYDRLVVEGMRYINEFSATFSAGGYWGCIDFFRRNLKEFKAAQEQISVHGPRYPPMKLIDMYFWSIGNQLQELKKKNKMETR
jgi:hypothetical protein